MNHTSITKLGMDQTLIYNVVNDNTSIPKNGMNQTSILKVLNGPHLDSNDGMVYTSYLNIGLDQNTKPKVVKDHTSNSNFE